MKVNVYVYRDKKAHFGNPFCQINDQVAMRGMALDASMPDSVVGFAPSDFDLYCIGTWDSVVGVFEKHPLPEFVCSADDAINVFSERGVR